MPERQQDVTRVKNYLDQPEIKELNQVVVVYLDYSGKLVLERL